MVDRAMLLDSTFIIDMQREILRKRTAGAHRFLADHPEIMLRISIVTYGELAEGFATETVEAFQELVHPFQIIMLTNEMAWRFGVLSRLMRSSGQPLGDNDLWIAATALELGAPLVTRDRSHFERISGLSVMTY
jgi:predicted nucleic acid-binding protein